MFLFLIYWKCFCSSLSIFIWLLSHLCSIIPAYVSSLHSWMVIFFSLSTYTFSDMHNKWPPIETLDVMLTGAFDSNLVFLKTTSGTSLVSEGEPDPLPSGMDKSRFTAPPPLASQGGHFTAGGSATKLPWHYLLGRHRWLFITNCGADDIRLEPWPCWVGWKSSHNARQFWVPCRNE